MKLPLKTSTDFLKRCWNTTISIGSASFRDDITRITKCDVLLICHDVDRPLTKNGKAYSPLLDSVRQDMESRGLSCISVAHPWSALDGNAAHGSPISLNKANLIFRLAEKVHRVLRLSVFRAENPYALIIEKSGAKLLISIGSSIEMSEIAREKKILHVELLHAIGYTSLPWGWDRLQSTALPQGILSLDHVSSESFDKLKEKGIDIHTIPHPFLKQFIGENKEYQMSEWRSRHEEDQSYRKRIIVTFNWSHTSVDVLRRGFRGIKIGVFLELIMKLVEEDKGVFWHFRVHPVQLRSPRFRYLRNAMDELISPMPNADWRRSSNLPLPCLAEACDGNISMYSMACYDVAMLGVPSLMMSPKIQPGEIYQNKFSDLESEGYVKKENLNTAVIRDWVAATRKSRPRLANLEDDPSWQNAVKWMLDRSGLSQSSGRRAISK